MISLFRTVVSICSVILLTSCINDRDQVHEDLKVGDRIPDFLVEMNDGSTVSSGQLSNGVAVIMFFHTTCPDCARTLPEIQKLYNAYKSEDCSCSYM